MDIIKKFLSKWIINALVFVVGILSIVAGAELGGKNWESISSSADSLHMISMVLGITLIVVSALSLLLSLVMMILARKPIASSGIVSGILLSVGIWFVVYDTAGSLIVLTVSLIPFFMIVIGALYLIDCLHSALLNLKYKEVARNQISLLILFLISVAAIILGSLCIATGKSNQTIIPRNVQIIILGIILSLEGLFQFLASFVGVPKFVVFEK
mgnify:FL=1